MTLGVVQSQLHQISWLNSSLALGNVDPKSLVETLLRQLEVERAILKGISESRKVGWWVLLPRGIARYIHSGKRLEIPEGK